VGPTAPIQRLNLGRVRLINVKDSWRAMKELVEAIAKALVDYPDHVQVRAAEGERVTVFELRADPRDLGKVIGRQGRTVQAMRTILNAVGVKLRKRFVLESLISITRLRLSAARGLPRLRLPQSCPNAEDFRRRWVHEVTNSKRVAVLEFDPRPSHLASISDIRWLPQASKKESSQPRALVQRSRKELPVPTKQTN
jgi:hypothetical protein